MTTKRRRHHKKSHPTVKQQINKKLRTIVNMLKKHK